MKTVLTSLVFGFGMFYLIGAFVTWQFNAAECEAPVRFLYVWFSLIASIVTYMVLEKA